MAYEDIYKGLTEEERKRMIKADIPKFEIIGDADLTEEQLKQGEKELFQLMEKFKSKKATGE